MAPSCRPPSHHHFTMTTVSNYADAGWTLEREQQQHRLPGHTVRPIARTGASYSAASPVVAKPGMPLRRLTSPSSDDVRLATTGPISNSSTTTTATIATKSSTDSSKRRPVSRRRDLLDALRGFTREQTPADMPTAAARRKSSTVSSKSSAASSSTAAAHGRPQEQPSADAKAPADVGSQRKSELSEKAPAENHRRSRSLFFNQKALLGKGEGKMLSQKAIEKKDAEAAALARFNAMNAAVAASTPAAHDIVSEVMLAEIDKPDAAAEYSRVIKSFAVTEQPSSMRPTPEERRKRANTVASRSPPTPSSVSLKQQDVDATVLLLPTSPHGCNSDESSSVQSSKGHTSATLLSPTTSRKSFINDSGASVEAEDARRLSSQLLIPSNMAPAATNGRASVGGRRPSSAARRFAEETRVARFRSQESLLLPRATDGDSSSFAKFHLPDAATMNNSLPTVNKEAIRALPPPRRHTRRARAQSSIESMRDDVTAATATLMRASASMDNAYGPQKFVSTAGGGGANSIHGRLQRRTSESSLVSSTASMSASVRPRAPSFASPKRLQHADSFSTNMSRGSSSAELTGQQGDRHSSCSSIESITSSTNDICFASQHRVSPLEHPYHTRYSHVSPSLASYASAQSDVWGSCYSSSSAASTKASSPTRQVPPVPAVPAKYAMHGGGISAAAHVSSIVAHISSPSLSRHTQSRRTPLKRCESEVSMGITNCIRRGAANTTARYARDDCQLSMTSSPSGVEDDDGPISLETPTFGYVASFVTAASNTPRASDQAFFRGAKASYHATMPPPRPSSAQSGWSSTWALGDYDLCALGDDPKRGLIPFCMSEVVPVSPKTVEAGWEQRGATGTATVSARATAPPMVRSFSTQGLGLSHVKMALAEHTHSLQQHSLPCDPSAALASRFSQDIDSSVATPASSRQSSVSKAKRGSSFSQQTLNALLQQRRTSLRMSTGRTRGSGAVA